MPHIVIEHSYDISDSIKSGGFLEALGETLACVESFRAPDIKVRAIGFDSYILGKSSSNNPSRSFCSVQISVLSGRERRHLETALSKCGEYLVNNLPNSVEITLEIREMDRGLYFKRSTT